MKALAAMKYYSWLLAVTVAMGIFAPQAVPAQQTKPNGPAQPPPAAAEDSPTDSMPASTKPVSSGVIETPDKSAGKQPVISSSATPILAQQAMLTRHGCVAVRSIGSHIVRNTILWGATGALLSKEQYQVVDVLDYPARIGEKLHGGDLQTISSSAKVVVLEKHYTADELHRACQ